MDQGSTKKNVGENPIWDAIDGARSRLITSATAIREAGVEFAVCGEQALMAWIQSVEPSCIRFYTGPVPILVSSVDASRSSKAVINAGFEYRDDKGRQLFVQFPFTNLGLSVEIRAVESPFQSVLLPVAPEYSPDVRVELPFLCLNSLVEMELLRFRNVNRVNIRDLLDAGVIDETWTGQLAPMLADRLREILADPNG